MTDTDEFMVGAKSCISLVIEYQFDVSFKGDTSEYIPLKRAG